MAREELKKTTRNINNHNHGKRRNRGAWNAHLIDVDILACVCGILDLVVPEQKKGDLKLLSKYILR